MHPEAERQRGKREREKEKASFCVCEGTLSSSPQNPWRGLPCQSISWSWLQSHPMGRHTRTHTHANTQTWLDSPYCESSAILLLHTDRHTHLARWDDSEEMASSSWGVPSLLYRNCSTPEASPCPILTLCACMRLCVGVCCAVLFVCWQI